jgi:hypothetical protein
MQLMPSRNPNDNILREARNHVLNGRPIPALLAEKLWARNIDVTELEHRLMQSQAYAS